MPLLSAISRKRRSYTPSTSQSSPSSSSSSSLLSRLPLNQSSPAVYYSSNAGSSAPPVHPRSHRSTEYHSSTGAGMHHHHHHLPMAPPPPPPYDYRVAASSSPTPSTSWTSEMRILADKIRGETSFGSAENLDRWSISQGMKLVAIAADEYDDGNETVALDIYLSGIDKILMALPNKTDARTKAALREKLTSVEERVGILNLAVQHQQKRQEQLQEDIPFNPSQANPFSQTFGLRRITSTLGKMVMKAHGPSDAPSGDAVVARPTHTSVSLTPAVSKDAVDRFKQFGQFFIHLVITFAVLIKQSPLPDIAYFVFGYIVQLLLWFDSQYHIAQKIQDLSVECVKLLLWADEEYRLHEFASEALYMMIAAALKAAVAYKEAPGYREYTRNAQAPTSIQFFKEQEAPLPCPSPRQPPVSSRTTWMWASGH